MSDEIATQENMDPNIGTTEDVGMETQVSDAPYLETENYSNHVVRVKLDGEELQVPLSEALAGYQRQADYTRKTQELAEQRSQMQYAATIQTALERDPEATIDLLARHYNISRSQAAAVADEVDDFQSLDPQEQKMRELDKRVASFEEYQSQLEVEKEVQRLQQRYSDFDVPTVCSIRFAAWYTDLEGHISNLCLTKLWHNKTFKNRLKRRNNKPRSRLLMLSVRLLLLLVGLILLVQLLNLLRLLPMFVMLGLLLNGNLGQNYNYFINNYF
jgi:hypothetical protein